VNKCSSEFISELTIQRTVNLGPVLYILWQKMKILNYKKWKVLLKHPNQPICFLFNRVVNWRAEARGSVNQQFCSNVFAHSNKWAFLCCKSNASVRDVFLYVKFLLVWKYMSRVLGLWSSKYKGISVTAGPAFDYNYDGLPDNAETLKK